MLRLGRNLGQSIIIDGTIEVMVVNTNKDGYVTLGIIADPSISVHRKEIQELIDSGKGTTRPQPKITYKRKIPKERNNV